MAIYNRLQIADHLASQLAHEGFLQVSKSGAESILRGTLTVGKVKTEAYNNPALIKFKKGPQYVYSVRKTLLSSVTYAVETPGEVLGGNTYSSSFDETWTGSSAAEARANALSDDQIAGNQIGALARNIIEGMSTHKELWTFNLQDAGNDFLEAGNLYYKKGLYSQAEEYWKKVQSGTGTPRELAAANYNLGVYRMKDGRIDEAFRFFREADHLVPANSVYMDALAKLETAAKGRETMRRMNAAGTDPAVEEAVTEEPKSTKRHRKGKKSRRH